MKFEDVNQQPPALGRDLNPFGRGDGTYYANGGNAAGGSLAISRAKPSFLGEIAGGYGNSVNNYLSNRTLRERVARAGSECGLVMVLCPTFWGQFFRDDPCQRLNLADPYEFCCICIPAMCPEGKCESPYGCAIKEKTEDYYKLCKISESDECGPWCARRARDHSICLEMMIVKLQCVARCIAVCAIECRLAKANENWDIPKMDELEADLDICCGKCRYSR